MTRRVPSFSSVIGSEMAFDAPVDEVDEAVLLEVADLEHAGGRALRQELQDPGQIEPVDRALKEHRPPAVAVPPVVDIGMDTD